MVCGSKIELLNRDKFRNYKTQKYFEMFVGNKLKGYLEIGS